MADMIKFFKGLEASLPTSGVNGALYITTDEGAIYLGTGTGMKRLGDFVQVDNVASLPTKAHESCLYYCVAENILAKWNGAEWKQINKQPTAEELKGLLGLGSLAYKSEVAEGDLNADLKAKVNAAAEGNHSHANKALLDTYTQTEADLADAVAKKHAHANADELAKFVDGDKAKYDAVVADHLTSADKTTLENSIKDAKKAGTDANTALETYKVSNDARLKAVEDDVAEIVDGTNGILAQAKGYSDGKLATARTEISAEIDADVKAVNDALEAYKTSNDSALAGVKATANAAAVKTEVEAELAKKVDKVEGKSLIADSEIARLADVHNYDDTQVKADIAKKADSAAMTTELGKKVDKVEGYSLVADTEIARLADVDNYDDAEVRGLIGDNADAIGALADKVGTVPEGQTVMGIITNIQENAYDDTELRGLIGDNADAIDAIEADYLKAADKTELAGLITTEKERAEGIEGGLRTDVDAIKGDYLKASDKTELEGKITAEETRAKGVEDGLAARIKAVEDDYLKAEDKTALQEQITANANAITTLTNGVDPDKIDGLNDLIEWADTHAPEVNGIKTDIEANAKAIEDEAARADAAEKLLAGRLDTLEGINHDAYVAADTALKTELQGEIDADVKAAIDAEVLRADGAYDKKGDAAAAQAAAEATAAGALASARTEITAEIGTAISGEVSRADGKYEEKGVAQGIVDALKLAETYEPIGAESRAIAAAEGKVNALAGNVYTKTEVENLMSWGEF